MSSETCLQQEPDWSSAPEFGRRNTLRYTLLMLHLFCEEPPVIVEIGTSRDERPEACSGDGWSTRAWGWFALQVGGKAYTVDIDPEAIDACKRITVGQAAAIEYVVSDSLEFLRNWNVDERGKIDLLYLDSLDYNCGQGQGQGSGDTPAALSEKHHLAEAQAALPLLADRCLVLIDDTYPDPSPLITQSPFSPFMGEGPGMRVIGKGALAVPFLLNNGFEVEFDSGGQALLLRGAAEITPPDDEALRPNAERRTPNASAFRPNTHYQIPNTVSAIVMDRFQAYARRYWLKMPPLVTIGHSYCEFDATAEARVYLDTVARLCGEARAAETPGIISPFPVSAANEPGKGVGGLGSALEIGPTSAYAQAFLARRGVCASGVLLDADLIERARQSAHWLGVDAEYTVGGLFTLDADNSREDAEPRREEEILSHKKTQNAQKNADTTEPKADAFLPNAERLTPNASALRPNTQHQIPNTERRRFTVIHHSNLAAALPTPWLLAMLRQQTALAEWVVFSVDSVFAEQNDELDEIGCRRLTPEMWQELLSDFEIGDLRTYGPTGKERILITLRGARSAPIPNTKYPIPGLDPYPFGISLIIHTRNEAHQIIDCIKSADGLADEIIVCDMESDDATDIVVAQFSRSPALPLSPSPISPVRILRHPLVSNFDSARNASAMFARYRFIFYLDADERIPPGMAARIRHILATQGHLFEAMALPFRNIFCGKEMNCIYGYKAASIYKNGWFFYNARPHQGARIDGRLAHFPADNPAFALPHMSYLNLSHYIKKMDGYTSTEAANMVPDRRQFHWQEMMAHSVRDMIGYEMRGALANDGPHGLVWMLCSGFYRVAQYGKYWQQRCESGQATVQEAAVPATLEEALEFMLAVARQTREIHTRAEAQRRRGDT